MLKSWERQYPGRVESMFKALANVKPSHLLDRTLFDFASLRPNGVPQPEGDLAFDRQQFS
jgi:tRNA 2-thiocytidine biosynthesis protein TtcA